MISESEGLGESAWGEARGESEGGERERGGGEGRPGLAGRLARESTRKSK